MTNVTLSLPDDVARWARIRAAEQHLSVSKMLSLLLMEKMEAADRYDAAMETFLCRQPRALKKKGPYPARDAIHER